MPRRKLADFPLSPGNRERTGTYSEGREKPGSLTWCNTSLSQGTGFSNGNYREVWKKCSPLLRLLSFPIESLLLPYRISMWQLFPQK